MFKAARWRSERNRIKAVFKLQFRATQVPQVGWEKMMVTLVPIDVGKPSQRSERTPVTDGACQWLNPIHETVKLAQDMKNGKINDKVYQFLVSATGSGKSGVLGEISVNLAEYAEVYKPTFVSLPLQDSNAGAILHVTIQRVLTDLEGRETTENGEISKETVENRDATGKPQRRTLMSQLSSSDCEESTAASKGMTGVNLKEEDSCANSQEEVNIHSARSMPLHADSSGNLRKSSSFDGTSASGSESSSGQFTPRESTIKNNNASLPLPLSSSGSIGGSTNNSGETGLREKLPGSNNNLEKQKSDVDTLARQLEVSELELQTLRKQVMKESKRGQDLSRELSSLKEERDALRKECEEHKASKIRIADNEDISARLHLKAKDPWSMLEEMKQELDHEKNLNANVRLQLQKTQESNSELIFAVRDLEELLEQKNKGESSAHEDSQQMEFLNQSDLRSPETKKESFEMSPDHEEQCELDILVKNHDNAKAAYSEVHKILDLNSELELYKKDREDLEIQMEQLALDYEILKQENHDISARLEQTQLREQLRMQYECSAHLAIINDLEAHVESLERELEEQANEYEANLATLARSRVEQEKRAIQAEEALRKARWKSANTAEQIQDEFKRLSAQMSSTFYANEDLVMKALTESRELRLEKCHLKELLDKSNEELSSLQHHHHVKCEQLLSLIDFKTKEVDGLLLELKSIQGQLDSLKKSEDARQSASKEEISVLKAEMEQLSNENSHLVEQIEQKENLLDETETLQTSKKELEMLLEERNLERDKLEKELATIKEEANKSLKELTALRELKDEQDTTIKTLNIKVESLQEQYSELKHCISDEELEKENLRKQVFLLRGDLRKEAGIIASIEKRLKDNNAKLTVSEGSMKTNITSKSKIFSEAVHGSQAVVSLQNNKSPKGNIINQLNGDRDDFQEISNAFDRSDIAHLEDSNISKNFKDDKMNGANINECHLHKIVAEDKEFENYSSASTGRQIGRCTNLGENTNIAEETLVPCQDNQLKIEDLLSKIEALREHNESMETELKEMQERYSEMSLKFAEVEGERQQLVINIRTLKNALKN